MLAGDDSRHNYAGKVVDFATQLGIEKHVITVTDRPRVDFPLLYSTADIFVSPTDNVQETFGQTTLEGMSAGLPVVCTDWDGYSVSVLHEKTGFRIPTYWMECDADICTYAPLSPWLLNQFYLSQSVCFDVQQMADRLFSLIEHDQLRKKMGSQARQHMLETYDWKIIIHRYIELWEELYQIAAAHPVTVQQLPSWYRPQYFKTFEHYATTTLQPTTQVKITDVDHELPTKDQTISWYNELNTRLNPEIIDAILSLSSDWITTAELEQSLSKHVNISTEKSRYHLLWLLKYNWLTLNVETVEQPPKELATTIDFEA